MKQGKIEQSVLVSLLIGIIVVSVILGIAYLVFSDTNSGASDVMCNFNTGARHILPTGFKYVMPLYFCSEVKIGDLQADAYELCPKLYDGDVERCGAYQLANLADRCLYRGAGRNSELGAIGIGQICFKHITIRNLRSRQISEKEIKDIITENDFSHKIRASDIVLGFEESESIVPGIDVVTETNIVAGVPFRIYFVRDLSPGAPNYICIGDSDVCRDRKN